METAVKITIDPIEQEKIWWYVDKCPKEISGLGKVIKRDDGSLHISKIYLLKQECTSSDTELDDEAVADLLYETRNEPGALLFWWHSHVDMQVFWSNTDYEAIEKIGSSGMVISTVYNKRREMRTSLYIAANELSPTVFLDELDLEVDSALPESVVSDLEAQYKDKVTLKSFAATYPKYNSYRGKHHRNLGWQQDDWDDDYAYPTFWSGTDKKTMQEVCNGINKASQGLSKNMEFPCTSDMFDKYMLVKDEEKYSFIEAYEQWFGTLDMSDMEEREEFLKFCHFYDYDFEQLDADWGYSASTMLTGV